MCLLELAPAEITQLKAEPRQHTPLYAPDRERATHGYTQQRNDAQLTSSVESMDPPLVCVTPRLSTPIHMAIHVYLLPLSNCPHVDKGE